MLTLALAALAAGALAIHRFRVARAVELERVRTRIATDLHDDIGSSLSRIAILTELLQRRADPAAKPLTGTLGRIAGLSRELVDSMSDIVWAINPKRDRLSDVVFRMRRFASDAFTGSDIEFSFRAPAIEEDPRVGPDLRRELYLVFKESVNNAVRHSGCSSAAVELSLDRRAPGARGPGRRQRIRPGQGVRGARPGIHAQAGGRGRRDARAGLGAREGDDGDASASRWAGPGVRFPT